MNSFFTAPFASVQSSGKKLKVFLLLSLVSCALVILYVFDPAAPNGIYPPSPFRLLTGLFCPGCGTLRGLHALLHGDIKTALDFNPLMVVSLPYLIYSFYTYCSPIILGHRVQSLFIRSSWIMSYLTVVLVFWVLRNLPYPPFSILAP